MTDTTDASDATADLPSTPPEAPLPPAPQPAAPIANPFVPVYKEPWVNPAKRTKSILAAVVAAIVLLGAGFAIGVHVGRHHDHRVDFRIERGVQGQFPGGGPVVGRNGVLYGGGPGQKVVRPGKNIPRQGISPSAPKPPAPSGT